MKTLRIIRGAGLTTAILCAAVPLASQAFAAHQAAPVVTSVALHLESAASKINPKNGSLTTVHPGEPFRLILYASLTGVTQSTSADITLTITRDGRRQFGSQGTFTISRADLGGGTAGTRWFWNTVPPCALRALHGSNCLPHRPGRYTATASLSINGRQYNTGASFTETGP